MPLPKIPGPFQPKITHVEDRGGIPLARSRAATLIHSDSYNPDTDDWDSFTVHEKEKAIMAGKVEPAAFAKYRKAGRIVVADMPKLDLDAYIANYKGRTRFDRLLLIGTSSTHLYLDALKLAIAESKTGWDVQAYEKAVAALADVCPNDRDAVPDLAWVDKTKKAARIETEKLELELKGYKNNLIKESIRMGYDDLGAHYQRIGHLPDSNKAVAKMRDFCTTNAHIVIMSMQLINISINQQSWLAVQSNVTRVRTNAGSSKHSDAEKNGAKLSAAAGISLLASGNYRDAAKEFLETDPRMAGAKMDDPTDEEAYNEVCTPNDIAVYGGLTALASMDRDQLQRNVLDHKTFRNYLELEPHIRRAISHFVSAKYSACLQILDSYKADYLLDIYLQNHVNELYYQIRSKAIQQYFIPFSCVTFTELAKAFNTDEETIEVEVTQMIKRGNLAAKIDLVDRLLVAPKKDGRYEVQEKALETAIEYEKTLHLRLLRMNMINAGLEVKGPKQQGGGSSSSQQQQEQGSMFNGGAGDLMGNDGQ